MQSPPGQEGLPTCPNCKADVQEPERTYNVVVEPENNERGITKRDVGMYRCPRCDTSFPRVLGRRHYLLVSEPEFNRIRKEVEDLKNEVKGLQDAVKQAEVQKAKSEESLRGEIRDKTLADLESELRLMEKHVQYIKSERDRLKEEVVES